jgi:hypothetical protein
MPSTSLAELSGLLWRERDVLDQLVHRLRDGDGDPLTPGEVEADGLLGSISSLELHRAITAREVALELGLEGEPSLQDLIERSDDEWATLLAGHRLALRELTDEVRRLLRRVPAAAVDGNVIALPAPGTTGRTLQRSLRDFLV